MTGPLLRAQTPEPVTPRRVRRRFRVAGVVQGVGFRPFVYVTATSLSLTGEVCNDSTGVVVEVEGPEAAVAELGERLRTDAPPLARVERVLASDLPVQGGTQFTIAETQRAARGRTLAGPDVATCADCLHELADPADRRYGHPFISCTNCGPRFTVITSLPYDRDTTTMAGFALCSACAREYADPRDRRFHAQTIACHDCGPVLRLERPGQQVVHGRRALPATRDLLSAGVIVAVKGLGGYHLVCDAGSEQAVAELRRRKRRGDKPFAIMAADLQTVCALARTTPAEEALLTGPARPIVLLERRRTSTAGAASPAVASSVAPGKPHLGVLLPYTGLHALLLAAGEPGPQLLVMTSGNRGGEPIAYRDEDARERLAPLVDAFLSHDRPIAVPCDDSVVRVVDGEELPLRRSRGYAPLPVALPAPVPPTLAVGADLKNTCCVADDRYAWLSQHVGDMDDLATLEALTGTEQHLEQLTGVSPEQLVTDRHPGYRSSAWGRAHAAGRAVATVQHHHAHVAAVMGEHGLDGAQPVIGVAFDGTGYGTDGAIWGGEVLVADYKGFRRFAHLAYVPLPGGDAGVDRPYRMALSHLRAAGVPWTDDLAPVTACRPGELEVLAHQLDTGFASVATSSMGRLFDAVASLAGVRQVADYEAEAAIELEGLSHRYLAAGSHSERAYHLALRPGSGELPMVADPAPVIRAVVDDVRRGCPAGLVGVRFHLGVAELTVAAAEAARAALGLDTVVLGGGVFQNALLLSSARRLLRAAGFTVRAPRRLPPNDGGIALGQLLVATAQ